MDKKKKIFVILLLLGLSLSIIYLSSCTSTYYGRAFWWNVGDMEDYQKFPSRHLRASSSPLILPEEIQTNLFDSLSMNKGAVVFNSGEFHRFLAEQETRSLIIIKNGVNIFERYYHGYKRDTINRSFSIAKSLTSMLIGIAIKEGKIKSVNDWFHDYVPEYKDIPNFQPMNIHHLLNMTTGIDYFSGYMPWNDKVRAYYEPNMRKHLKKLEFIAKPGTVFQYNDYVPNFLALILENVYGQTITQLMQDKIWEPMGAEYEASWSLFSEEDGLEQVAGGFNARSIDYAKIGQLMLQRGEINGHQILDPKWVDATAFIDRDDPLQQDVLGIKGINYKYNWWHLDHNENDFVYTAQGFHGQYIMIYPKYRLVIVRSGDSMGELTWSDWIRFLADLGEWAGKQVSH